MRFFKIYHSSAFVTSHDLKVEVTVYCFDVEFEIFLTYDAFIARVHIPFIIRKYLV